MSLRPIVRGLIRQPLRLPTERRGGWSPLALFAAGEQGGWWDPSDFSTMFQDSAGTTPVTAVGQPVGLIRDKSGRGNHLLQATATSRPTLQQDASGFLHLLLDGVDDWMLTSGSVDFTTTDKVLAVAGVRKLSDAARGLITKNAGAAWQMESPNNPAGANFHARSQGTVLSIVNSPGIYAAPISAVVTEQADIAAPSVKLRVNQTEYSSAATLGTGNYTSAAIWMGADGTGTVDFFNGRIYGLIVRGTLSSAAQVAQTERYVGSKMGIAL